MFIKFSHRTVRSNYYLFHPNKGAIVHPTDIAQMSKILNIAVFFVSGWALKPLTMTLYLSKAMKVIVQIEPQPKSEPNIPYNSQKKGPRITKKKNA